MRDDRGQTLPLYIWLVGILLFVGFVFFVFAKGAVARSGAQSAADAAALAAAQDVRDQFVDGLMDGIQDGGWVNWIEGNGTWESDPFAAAASLAAANDSTLQGLNEGQVNGKLSFTASIQTNYAVGDSLVPGTEDMQANASATAVIEPRCEVDLSVDPTEFVKFSCDGGGSWEIDLEDFDPEDLDPLDLPEAKDLFSVQLAE
ncbi:pilus assembly protein TadG-related protein [Streptomyces apocyni]|uniref:pilus assembly protein TadG-related protein n=1 Tax=Streptomyces apocyni TaxID=2654677 RepID=UPI001E28B29C|nr:pilus assembly protein TadG-related protein [Streptomyces apocyni]